MSDLNKNILLVMKWLDDPKSVSKDELKEHRKDAYTAYTAYTANAADASYASYASYATASATASAATAYAAAEKWVYKYFERSGENKQDYIDAIGAGKVSSKEEPVQEWVNELPPAGCECEYKSEGHHEGFEWCIFHGLMSDKSYIIEYHHHTSPSRTTCCPFDPISTTFRPLKTQEQKDREAFIEKAKSVIEANDYSHRNLTMVISAIEKMFDAGFKAPEGE